MHDDFLSGKSFDSNRYYGLGMSSLLSRAGFPPPRGARSPRPDRLRALLFVGLANLVLACFVGMSYLDALPEDPGAKLWWFAHAGLVSSLLTLVLLPGSFLALAALSRISDRTFVIVQTLTWAFFHLTLFIDTRVFGLYHYHLNG